MVERSHGDSIGKWSGKTAKPTGTSCNKEATLLTGGGVPTITYPLLGNHDCIVSVITLLKWKFSHICDFLFQMFFCPEKRSGPKYALPASYVVLTESNETAGHILTQQVCLPWESLKFCIRLLLKFILVVSWGYLAIYN